MCQINSVPMRYAVGYLDVLTPPTFEPVDQDISGSPSEQEQQAASKQSASPVVVAQEGANASLACQARGHPEPSISWRREDNEPIEVAALEAPTGLNGPQLQFPVINRLHAGAYLCIASNGVLPAASKRQVLDVQFAPVVRVPQTEIAINLQQQQQASSTTEPPPSSLVKWGRANGLSPEMMPSIQLVCYVELNPSGSLHWIRLSGPGQQTESDAHLLESEPQLTNSDKYEIVIKSQEENEQRLKRYKMSLLIRGPSKQDLGWYRCIAKNPLGIQSGSIRLHEAPSPSAGTSFTAFNELFRSALSSGNGAGDQQQQGNGRSRSQMTRASNSRSISNPQQATAGSEASKLPHNLSTPVQLLSYLTMIVLMLMNIRQATRFNIGPVIQIDS